MGDDFRHEEARRSARAWLAEPELMNIAIKKANRSCHWKATPGSGCGHYYRRDTDHGGEVTCVAIFNFDKNATVSKSIDLERLGLNREFPVRCDDLWEKASTRVSGRISLQLAPAESKN